MAYAACSSMDGVTLKPGLLSPRSLNDSAMTGICGSPTEASALRISEI